MEEYSHSEHVTGSPTAGESGFVHVESIDSASMDDSAINQDDGVVVTRVDNVQDDGGNEEFVDCPDDLLSYDEKTDFDESQESEAVSEVNQHTSFENEREILPHHYQEERQQLMTELTNLRHKLKLLIKKHPLIDGNEGALFTYEHAIETVAGDDMDKSLWPLHEVIFDCSRFIELALSEQSQTEHTVRELLTTLDTKDKEINALNVIVTEHHSLETTTDRILNSLGVKVEEFSHTSVSGKMSHLEKSISFLIENRNHFFSEVQMLNKGLTELKRKEVELINKSGHLENEYRKLMEHFEKGRETIKMLNSEIGRLKGESEVDKTKYNNTREKLNMAVTKGKSLVQQRDSLKQAVAEKTSELDKCLVNLQEKSTLANLLEDEYLTLQDEIKTMKEAASVNIDRLISSLVMETQKRSYLEDEFTDLTQKFQELCVLKDKNVSLKIDLQRSEDKCGLLREKLSMAVKKGKSLVQERDIMKQQISEKNSHIDGIRLELKHQEDRISMLESDLLHSKQERDKIEELLVERNTILQMVIDTTNEIVLPNDIKDPVEKVKWCGVYLKENQFSKAQIEQELRDVKDALLVSEKNVSQLTEEKSTLENVKTQIEEELQESSRTIKSLEDTLSVSEKTVSELTSEKSKLENVKSQIEEELQESSKTIKSLEDTLVVLEKNVSQLTSEKSKLENVKTQIEEELEESSKTIKSLEDTLSVSEKNVSELTSEKSKLESLKTQIEEKLQESSKTIKSLEDNVSELTSEKSKLENVKSQIEEELQESSKTIKSLENTVSQLQTQVSNFSHESEMKNLKDEVTYHESETIQTLQDSLLNANNTVSNLLEEKTNANIQLSTCKQELDLSSQILTDEFIRFSSLIDGIITSMLIKMEGIKNTIPVTLEQAKSLQKNIHDLEAELDKNRSTNEKVKEENHMLQNIVSKMETESQTMRDEMVIKLKDYQAKEDEWNRREAELSNQLKHHEVQRDVTEASTQSEISEVEDQVSIGKRSISLRKGSNDHFALDIDQESDRLINKQETVEDKGHVFKSLHTSGLVPPQGKVIADRLDGIWVSGGGALMSRPKARLGVIAYWLLLHLWLLGTLL